MWKSWSNEAISCFVYAKGNFTLFVCHSARALVQIAFVFFFSSYWPMSSLVILDIWYRQSYYISLRDMSWHAFNNGVFRSYYSFGCLIPWFTCILRSSVIRKLAETSRVLCCKLQWWQYINQEFTLAISIIWQITLMYHLVVFTSVRYSSINISTTPTPPILLL